MTILETDIDDLARAVAAAFDGASLSVSATDGLFDLRFISAGCCVRCEAPKYPTALYVSCCGRRRY